MSSSTGRTVLRNESEYDHRQAKQRACIKWLLSKAHNQKTPEELREPFYKDHDEVERLKPHIVHALANAELYGMALSNLYQDPNFHNLNHWGIIQALARKGIFVAEPADCALTETVLIQTNPLKMSAHLAVTEALMQLFLKEMYPIDRVMAVVKRLESYGGATDGNPPEEKPPSDHEEALLLWLNRCCRMLKTKAQEELQDSSPAFPTSISKITELSDGVSISALLSLYSPEDLNWTDIALEGSMSDSLYNIQLIQRFCLVINCFHLTLEDFVYSRDTIRLNIVCLLADLFCLLEMRPFKASLQLPGVEKTQVFEVPDPGQRPICRSISLSGGGAIPHLRPSLNTAESTRLITDVHRTPSGIRRQSSAQEKPHEKSGKSDESGFVVQRGRGVPTLASVTSSGGGGGRPSSPNKELLNKDSKSDERGETSDDNGGRRSSNGGQFQLRRPSNERVSFSGRRSRRNSVDDNASQLSIENMGGSQDNLHLLGRNPDKEMKVHTGRRLLGDSSSDRLEQCHDSSPSAVEKVSFADLRKQKAKDQFHTSGINITYNEQQDVEGLPARRSSLLQQQQRNKLKAAAAAATVESPVKQQQSPMEGSEVDSNRLESEPTTPDAMAAQLNSVRMKLEQRRKRIEDEKKKMESIMSKQREKVGQEAFLRAVGVKTNSEQRRKENLGQQQKQLSFDDTGAKPKTESPSKRQQQQQQQEPSKGPVSFKDMNEDLSAVQSRWLGGNPANRPTTAQVHPVSTPDVEAMDMDTYSQNLHAMNDSLHDLQSDIHRLSQQQAQIQQMMHSPQQQQPATMTPQPFYISHEAPPPAAVATPPRRTWGQPQPISFAHQQPLDHPVSGGGGNWQQQSPRRQQQQWGHSPQQQQQQQQQRPMVHANYGYGPPSSSHFGADPYASSPLRTPYGNPPMYNGYEQPGSTYGYVGNSPVYNSPHNYNSGYAAPPPAAHLQSPMPYGGHYVQPAVAPPAVSPARTPFRLHENKSPPPAVAPRNQQPPPPPPQIRRASEHFDTRQQQISPPARIHTSVPAPAEDEMAPQNVSFIESAGSDDDDDPLKRLPDRLSQLNISSGSKTYRVHETSPSPTRNNRPSISSTFKQNRRSSGGDASGPSSLRNVPPLNSDEEETLATMKTERLKDDKDAAAGFVISFDDDVKPKKPKPMLKERRTSSTNGTAKQSLSEFSSDGSNSSRKENVPPEVMICIDMNLGSDDGGRSSSPSYRKYSPLRNGASRSTDWRSYDPGEKFEIDPDVPLEPMAPIGTTTDEDLVSESGSDGKLKGLVIGDGLVQANPDAQDEMQKKKEKIMMLSLRRKQEQEESRIRREEETRRKELEEREKEEEKARKKEEEKARKNAILEHHKSKKEMERQSEERGYMPEPVSARPVPKLRSSTGTAGRPVRPRPKTIHVNQESDLRAALVASRGTRGSISNISGMARSDSRNSINEVGAAAARGQGVMLRNSRPSPSGARTTSRPTSRRGSTAFLNDDQNDSLRTPARVERNTRSMSQGPRGKREPSVSSTYGGGARDFRGSRESLNSGMTYSARRGSNAYEDDYLYGGSMRDLTGRQSGGRRKTSSVSHLDFCSYRGATSASSARETAIGAQYNSLRRSNIVKSRSFANLSGPESCFSLETSSATTAGITTSPSLTSPRGGEGGGGGGSGRATGHLGPGSLPGYRRRGDFDDGASDISSTSGFSAYGYRSGTRLYREPSAKSNRNIVLNAIEYVVFPGAVNQDTRERVLDVVDRCDCPHFLLLFRDQKCQFRGLYAYYPDTEEVYKIYGTGPKQVTDKMFEHFFKYNSGGKKFTKIHTKSLTVTIDAFTIHNSLWLGKKVNRLPDKKDMALVI